MPCRDGGPTIEQEQRTVIADQRERLDRVTDHLCGVLTQLEKNKQLTAKNGVTPALREWWADHKAKDAARTAREESEARAKTAAAAARQSGLSKLTPAERRALGLK